jgi:hypothetical protein
MAKSAKKCSKSEKAVKRENSECKRVERTVYFSLQARFLQSGFAFTFRNSTCKTTDS